MTKIMVFEDWSSKRHWLFTTRMGTFKSSIKNRLVNIAQNDKFKWKVKKFQKISIIVFDEIIAENSLKTS